MDLGIVLPNSMKTHFSRDLGKKTKKNFPKFMEIKHKRTLNEILPFLLELKNRLQAR